MLAGEGGTSDCGDHFQAGHLKWSELYVNQSLPEQASKQHPSGASASEQTLPHGILQRWAGTWKYKLAKSLPPLSCF